MKLPANYRNGKKLETLVEDRTTFQLERAEVHLFETHTVAEQVLLGFREPVLASMLTGKKIMHLQGKAPFAFLPGESVMLPPEEVMCIDFPEARSSNPTKCLAMAFEEEKIGQVIQLMNETRPKADGREWRSCDYNFHFANERAISQVIQRLLFLCMENHPSKDLFVDMMLNELIIRILQAESRTTHLREAAANETSDRLAHVVQYIRAHIREKLSVKELSRKACMSESHFHRVFKNELGLSPVEFINEERLKLAARLLLEAGKQVSEVYLECGFNSLSYFNRMFKRKHAVAPSQYQAGRKGRYASGPVR